MKKRIVILTGAGISAESGLSTFRDNGGLWNNWPVEKVASLDGFKHDPEFVRNFYNQLKLETQGVKPNAAHLAITKLQDNGFPTTVITQNVDLLHEQANTKHIYHVHGRLDQVLCLNCENIFTTMQPVTKNTICVRCSKRGTFKPNIVFFGEKLQFLSEILEVLEKAELFLAIGTSGVVYPAAGFIRLLKPAVPKLEFNLTPAVNRDDFDEHYYGNAATTLPKWVDNYILKHGV